MPKKSRPRCGSLQFWPRKRAEKVLPSVNWPEVSKKNLEKGGLLGFIGYKVGMTSVYVKDNTEDSMTKGKKIIVPATIVECPEMKIFSVRLYKNKKVVKDIIVSNEKELKSKLRLPKQIKKFEDEIKNIEFDDIRLIVYSNVKTTGIKKTPDLGELALAGTKEEKIAFVNEKLNKSISVKEVFDTGLLDVHALTKGKGLQGPMKRFGISLKSHKSEKGRRRPGSLAPWNPSRVTFRTPMAGQLGLFTRVAYNNLILESGKISEKDINKSSGFHKYGNIKTDYLILKGSVQGSRKRVLMLTPAIRPTRKTIKQKFEAIELR